MNLRVLLLVPLLLATACSKEEIAEPSPLPDISPTVRFVQQWAVDTGAADTEEGLALVPAVTGEAVFTADAGGRVEARTRAKGKLLWRRKTHAPFSAGPVAGYNQVFVGTREGELLAFSATDGSTLWRTPLTGEVLALPALNGDALAVKTSDGRISLLDRVSGAVRWTYDGGAPPLSLRASSSPLLLDDAVLAGMPSGMLIALDRASGQLIWERRIAEPSGKSELDRLVDIAGDFVLQDDHVYIATYQGRLAALDLRDGQFTWQQPASTYRQLAVGADAVYVADADGRVLAVRADDGVVLWRLESLSGRRLGGVTVFGDWLLVGDFEGWLHVIHRFDGSLLGRRKIDGDGLASAPVVDEGVVFALGRSGKLKVFRFGDTATP